MPGPKLNSTSVGRDLVLSWRTNYTGYVLQSSTDLSGSRWADCTNTVSIVGGQFFITNSVSGSVRYFRLRKITRQPDQDSQVLTRKDQWRATEADSLHDGNGQSRMTLEEL